MVSAAIGGIIPVVRGKNKKVILPKLFQKNAQIPVKLLDFLAVAFHVSSVSPQGIEINQIHKAKSPEILFADLDGLLHAVYGAVRMIGLCDSFAAENIVDLPYTDHIQPIIL